MSKTVNKTDLLLGIVFIISGLIIKFQVTELAFKVKIFPTIVLFIMIIEGIILIINAIVSNKKPLKVVIMKEELIVIFMLIVLFICFNIIGFYISIFLFQIVIYLYINKNYNRSTLVSSILFSLISTIVLYITFGYLIGLVMPKGLMFD